MEHIAGCEVEAVLNRRGRKQCVDDRRRVPGEAFHFAADGAPAKDDRVRNRQNPARKSPLQCNNRALQTRAELVAGRQILDAFLIFGDGENAQEQCMFRLRADE